MNLNYVDKNNNIQEIELQDLYSYDAPFHIAKDEKFNLYYFKLGQRPVESDGRTYPQYWTCCGHGSIEYKPESLFRTSLGRLMIVYRSRIIYPKLKDYPTEVLGNNGLIAKWSNLKVKPYKNFFKMVEDGWRYALEDVDNDFYIDILDKKMAEFKEDSLLYYNLI